MEPSGSRTHHRRRERRHVASRRDRRFRHLSFEAVEDRLCLNSTAIDPTGSLALAIEVVDLDASTEEEVSGSTGATSTEQSADSMAVVLPESFGARGDGVSDDTAALQEALNTGQTVFLGTSKTYRITRTIQIPSGGGITSDGTGTILLDTSFNNTDPANKFGPASVGILAYSAENVSLQHFIIRKIYSDGVFVNAIAIRGSSNIQVTGLDISGFSLANGIISLDTVAGAEVLNNSIHDSHSNASQWGQITGIKIDDDRVDGLPSRDVFIAGNRIRNLTVGPNFLGRHGYQTDGIHVASDAARSITIENNIIENVGEGIDVFGSENFVRNNVIVDAYIFGIKLVHGASRNFVSQNVIINPGLAGIIVSGSSVVPRDTAENTITWNDITGVNSRRNWPDNRTSALYLHVAGVFVSIPRSNVFENNSISDGDDMAFAILVEGGTQNQFVNNEAENWRIAYASDRGQNTVIRRSETSSAQANIDGSIPVLGDWDGDGIQTPGIVRDGVWYLRNSNTAGAAEIAFAYGLPGDYPIVGDWDGDGTDTPGVVRSGTWYLRNSHTTGPGEIVFSYGLAGDRAVVGDWDGDGVDTPGVVRSGSWHLRNSNTTGIADVVFAYGLPGDHPIVGDWDGDGTDTPGVVRGGSWYLRNSNTTGIANLVFTFGVRGDVPAVGDWDGDQASEPGIARNLGDRIQWRLRGTVDAGAADVVFEYGLLEETLIAPETLLL